MYALVIEEIDRKMKISSNRKYYDDLPYRSGTKNYSSALNRMRGVESLSIHNKGVVEHFIYKTLWVLIYSFVF